MQKVNQLTHIAATLLKVYNQCKFILDVKELPDNFSSTLKSLSSAISDVNIWASLYAATIGKLADVPDNILSVVESHLLESISTVKPWATVNDVPRIITEIRGDLATRTSMLLFVDQVTALDMSGDKNYSEICKGLRSIAELYPEVDNPTNDTDRMHNLIHEYCTLGADAISNLINTTLVLSKEVNS